MQAIRYTFKRACPRPHHHCHLYSVSSSASETDFPHNSTLEPQKMSASGLPLSRSQEFSLSMVSLLHFPSNFIPDSPHFAPWLPLPQPIECDAVKAKVLASGGLFRLHNLAWGKYNPDWLMKVQACLWRCRLILCCLMRDCWVQSNLTVDSARSALAAHINVR
jgi:hypothetical protein